MSKPAYRRGQGVRIRLAEPAWLNQQQALCSSAGERYHRGHCSRRPRRNLQMGPQLFRRSVTIAAQVISVAILFTVFSAFLLAQTKPERQSKAAKAAEAPQSAQGAQTPAAASAKSDDEDEPAKPEEKAFKGMKYRMIGPFRGGRSLTAAGIPGDPTTYYFG